MITGVDHIAVTVRDLDAAVRAYEAILGRAPNWRGAMPGVRHAWFQLPNMALDVIGADGAGAGADNIRAEIEKFGEGIWGLGFSVPDMAEALRLFERRGIAFTPTHATHSTNERGLERAWQVTIMRRKSAHGLAQFLVQQAAEKWPVSPARDGDASVAGLDHIVVQTRNADRAMAHYGARLGLDLRLDRSNEQWGSRLLFFRCGDLVIEVSAKLGATVSDENDKFGGLAWRIVDPAAARARMLEAGFDVSELRKGRKPGTQVFTVRGPTFGVPTLMIGAAA
jgi:catechol 2,3-dioxygenase-like lactoylglutathione lyase family enzyme